MASVAPIGDDCNSLEDLFGLSLGYSKNRETRLDQELAWSAGFGHQFSSLDLKCRAVYSVVQFDKL